MALICGTNIVEIDILAAELKHGVGVGQD